MPEPVYLLARLRIRYGELDRFNELMKISVERVAQSGWKLVGSYQAVIGDLTEVIDIWEVPDVQAAYDAVDPRRENPARAAQIARLHDVIESEVLQIVTKTPFSP